MLFIISIKRKKLIWAGIFLLVITGLWIGISLVGPIVPTFLLNEELTDEIQAMFEYRSEAMLKKDEAALGALYDRNLKYGTWAYEHEIKKMNHLHEWAQKQGVVFTSIDPKTIIRWTKNKGQGWSVNLSVKTQYTYQYDQQEEKNVFMIGTYHSMDIVKGDSGWIITREWYADPFGDTMYLDETQRESIKQYIQAQSSRDFSQLIERRAKAVAYAHRYSGLMEEEKYSYNKKYKNYNGLGGDCTNFASQVLHEGGFRKNSTWNYEKEGSRAWVNAKGFKEYMLYSGRASLVEHGNYDRIYKAAYKLMPGDVISYEEKGKIVHTAIVTGADSKGYPLVNSHNTDRYKVPWDLGWSSKGIKFWLIHVHY